MFTRNTMTKVLGTAPEMTTTMIDAIEAWRREYDGQADWITDTVRSLRIEHGICREFADVTLSEMEVVIENDKFKEVYDRSLADLNENLQSGLALGSFILKPLGNGAAEFVTADMFVPISFGLDKRPNDIAFLDVRHVDTNLYYVRVERHSTRDGFLTITNTAYSSNTEYGFDRQIPLDTVAEWAALPEAVSYPGMTELDFGFYRNPIKNDVDGSNCGVSIFHSAIDAIRKADTQAARLDWEFESGERAVNVDAAALRKDNNGAWGLPKLNKRLYRAMDMEAGDGKSFYQEFSPALREANYIAGLEAYKREIEFAVGLAYGDLSDVQTVDKTATEIKASKQRKYNRVNAIESNLRECLEGFAIGLAFHEGMFAASHDIVVKFNDSILTDETEERNNDRQDVAMGAMPLWQYRMKWYGESEEEAKQNVTVPESDVMF